MAVSGERRGAAGGTGRRRMVGVSRSRKPPLLAYNRTGRPVSRRKRRRSGSNVNLGGEGIGVGVDVGLLQLSILKAGSRVGWRWGRGEEGQGPWRRHEQMYSLRTSQRALKQMCTADLGSRSQGTGHKCTCSPFLTKGQANSERDATFRCLCERGCQDLIFLFLLFKRKVVEPEQNSAY